MDWWRHYLVRYLLGNIIGSVIVGYYLTSNDLWNSLGLDAGGENGFPASQRLIVLAVLGFAYCYISSVPVLMYHGFRHNIVSFGKDNNKFAVMQYRPLLVGLVCVLMFIILFFSYNIIQSKSFFCDSEGNFLFESITVTEISLLGVTLYTLILATTYGMILRDIFVMISKRKSYYNFLHKLDKKRQLYKNGKTASYACSENVGLNVSRNVKHKKSAIKNVSNFNNSNSRDNQKSEKKEDGEFINSYRHLREHGNAFFIVLFELILLPVFLSVPYSYLPILVVLWVTPGAMMWWYASWIEVRWALE